MVYCSIDLPYMLIIATLMGLKKESILFCCSKSQSYSRSPLKDINGIY